MRPDVNVSAQTLGVVAIARNEERDLPGFLSNLLPWVDEVVIVDDRSEDRTVEIAEGAGPKVRVIDGVGGPMPRFDCLRNAGIQCATADWLLHMDIDERVPPEMAQEIRAAISSPNFDAYRFRRLNFFLNRPMRAGGLQRWNQVHLARRDLGRFENPIHETMRLDCPKERIGQLREPIWHLNDENYAERMRKSEQYCRLVAERERVTSVRGDWWRMLSRPLIAFVRIFVVFGGFRDGVPGLVWALHCASAELRIAILHWESEHPVARDTIERRLDLASSVTSSARRK